MDELILGNITARPLRSASSILGIALGVSLTLLTVGLARGMLMSSGERDGNVRAELLFLPPGGVGTGLTPTPLALPTAYASALRSVPGVAAAVPVARYLRPGARGIGFELVEGVPLDGESGDAYRELAGLSLQQGRWPRGENEIVVDIARARDSETALGAELEILGEPFRVVGVYAPEVGARIKMPIGALQGLLGSAGKASWILVRVEPSTSPEEVGRRIEAHLPGNHVLLTRDVPGLYLRGLPSLSVFLNVVVGLAVVISALTVFLSLYTAVMERTREIGIIKSMGGSKLFIVALVEAEALVLALLGAAAGLLTSAAARFGIVAHTPLAVRFEWPWVVGAVLVALSGGLLGALYPALRAARLEPVEALGHE